MWAFLLNVFQLKKFLQVQVESVNIVSFPITNVGHDRGQYRMWQDDFAGSPQSKASRMDFCAGACRSVDGSATGFGRQVDVGCLLGKSQGPRSFFSDLGSRNPTENFKSAESSDRVQSDRYFGKDSRNRCTCFCALDGHDSIRKGLLHKYLRCALRSLTIRNCHLFANGSQNLFGKDPQTRTVVRNKY